MALCSRKQWHLLPTWSLIATVSTLGQPYRSIGRQFYFLPCWLLPGDVELSRCIFGGTLSDSRVDNSGLDISRVDISVECRSCIYRSPLHVCKHRSQELDSTHFGVRQTWVKRLHPCKRFDSGLQNVIHSNGLACIVWPEQLNDANKTWIAIFLVYSLLLSQRWTWQHPPSCPWFGSCVPKLACGPCPS